MTNNLRVVNIGTGPSKNDGDQLRTAFNKINLNFADLVSGNIAVAGSGTGNGYTGSQGQLGPSGASGPIGYAGSRGASGSIGPTGPTGQQAVSANLKGSVDSVAQLPATSNTVNDAYFVSETNTLYVWDGAQWFDAGPIMGPSGSPGPSGQSGYTGSQGASGSIGYSGSQGVAGATGPSGLLGYTGSRGPSGTSGSSIRFLGSVATIQNLPSQSNSLNDAYVVLSDGTLRVWDNTTWVNCGALVGLVGATGPAGASGLIGPSGLMGPVGASGATGPAGLDGDTGPAGATGASGPSGIMGPKGDAGASGPKGDAGASGLKGLTGATGPIGLTGYTGSVGPSGPQGIGATGIKGFTGSMGPSGLSGSVAKVQNTIPSSSIGKGGDTAGDIVIDMDGGYLYVCSKNYDGSSLIWARLAITDTSF